MEKLNIETAKKLSKEYIRKIQDKDQRRFIKAHTKAVVKTAKLLAKGTDADFELLEIAGWLHDIGKAAADDNHAEAGVRILEENYEVDETLRDCILNHGVKKEPKTLEGNILRTADKVSLIDSNILPIFLKNINKKTTEDATNMLKNMLAQAGELLEKHNAGL
jgi:putative nucleotidyltransferase with HDIG domain